jgi:hypothetical protein
MDALTEHFSLPQPSPAERHGRLLAAGAASIALHVLVVAALAPPLPSPGMVRPPARILLAHLIPPAVPPATTLPPPVVADIPEESPPSEPARGETSADGPPLLGRARFAAPPDFRRLEMLTMPGEVRLKLRVHVSALGKLERIDVLETTLVSAEFLSIVKAQLQAAAYVPARTESGPIASDFTVEIGGSPEPEPAYRSFGNGKLTASE